jgi:nucleoside-diphosphate-sugar epimerase
MRVFLKGATGFIGCFLVAELVNAGHHVIGLSRSEAGAGALTRAGAEVFRSDDRQRTAAEAADGIIHAAFNHDFSNLKQNSEEDRKVIETLGEAPAGSERPHVWRYSRCHSGGSALLPRLRWKVRR